MTRVGKNGAYSLIIVVAVGASLFVAFGSGHRTRLPDQGFFIDEDSGEELIQPISDVPPLKGKSSKDSVVAEYKYSTDGGKTGQVAYYYKYTPEMKATMDALPPKERLSFDGSGGELVRLPAAGSKWVTYRSQEGQGVTTGNIHFTGSDLQRFFP